MEPRQLTVVFQWVSYGAPDYQFPASHQRTVTIELTAGQRAALETKHGEAVAMCFLEQNHVDR